MSRRQRKRRKQTKGFKDVPIKEVELPQKTYSERWRRLPLTIGLLGLDLFSRQYHIHHNEILSSYGHDFLGVPLWYLVTGGMFNRYSSRNIVLGTLLAYTFEGLQYMARNKTFPSELPSTYDPMDFIAYTAGAIFAYGLHRRLQRRQDNNF